MWEREAGDRIPPGPKVFLTDQYLPVWVRCTRKECQKWRKLPPSIELHHVKQDIVHCSNCEIPQDEVRGGGREGGREGGGRIRKASLEEQNGML